MAEQQEEVRQGLSDKISDLENFYADSVLGDDLKELYAEVQMKCIDFRTNVFMKNVDHLDENFGIFDRKEVLHTYSMGNIDELLKKVKLSDELLEMYEKKAKEL